MHHLTLFTVQPQQTVPKHGNEWGHGEGKRAPGERVWSENGRKMKGWRLNAKDLVLSAHFLPACPAQCHRTKGGVKWKRRRSKEDERGRACERLVARGTFFHLLYQSLRTTLWCPRICSGWSCVAAITKRESQAAVRTRKVTPVLFPPPVLQGATLLKQWTTLTNRTSRNGSDVCESNANMHVRESVTGW